MATADNSVELEPFDHGVKLTWNDNHHREFHYVWLRNCCYCKDCGSSYTGSRFLQPSDVPGDIYPKDISVKQDSLVIVWANDNHQSTYKLAWLKSFEYSREHETEIFHKPILWNSAISSTPPEVVYKDVQTDELSHLNLLRKLRDYGFVILRNGPRESNAIETIASLVGPLAQSAYSNIFDLKVNRSALTLGNTMKPVPPHTDEAYLHNPTGILVLHCICPAKAGGESILVDGFYLSNALRNQNPQAFELLATQPQTFHRIVPDDGVFQRTRAKVITTDENQNVVGFRFHTRTSAPLDVPFDKVLQVHSANSALSKLMLHQKNQACFKLFAGDTVLFDNHRVMHSRKGFTDPDRHLQICNVSRENFHQRLRYSANSLGFDSEAHQLLAAGVAG